MLQIKQSAFERPKLIEPDFGMFSAPFSLRVKGSQPSAQSNVVGHLLPNELVKISEAIPCRRSELN